MKSFLAVVAFFWVGWLWSSEGDEASRRFEMRDWQKTGTNLLRQDFENGWQGWTGSVGEGDTAESPHWELVNLPGHGGNFLARCQGINPQTFECIPKRKFLNSPVFQASGFASVVVSYYRRFLPAPRSGGVGKYEDLSVSLVNAAGKQALATLVENPLPQRFSHAKVEEWQLFTYVIPASLIAQYNGNVFLQIAYSSDRTNCETLQIDDISVDGFTTQAPETRIISPPPVEGPFYILLGETLTATADVLEGSPPAANFFWALNPPGTGSPTVTGEGSSFTYDFEQAGAYLLRCAAISADGNLDPTPVEKILVATSALRLDTQIVEPAGQGVHVRPNLPISFRAEATGAGGQETNFIWLITEGLPDRNTQPLVGQSISYTFPRPGRFNVFCIAGTADGFKDRSPALLEVEVGEVEVRITSPEHEGRRPVRMDLNQTLQLQGTVSGPVELIAHKIWSAGSEEIVACRDQDSCSYTFDKRGEVAISLAAFDAQGQRTSQDEVFFHVSPYILARIVEPMENEEILINTPFQVRAEIVGSESEQASVKWIANGQIVSTSNPLQFPTGLATKGKKTITLRVTSPSQTTALEYQRTVRIVDPSVNPAIEIIVPRTDLRLRTGSSQLFDARIDDPRQAAKNVEWKVVNAAGTEVFTSNNVTMGVYSFQTEGEFRVQLYYLSETGDVLVGERIITVSDSNPAGFSANATLENATQARSGNYENLSLDRPHYFEVEVPSDYLKVSIRVQIEGSARVVFYNLDGVTRRFEKLINGPTTLRVEGLLAGTYKWGVLPITGSAKKDLIFGFSLDVLNPGLYFTDVSEDTSYTTKIGMVNSSNQSASIDILAIGADGTILEKDSITIPAQGKFSDSVANLFPDDSLDISWIRVDSTVDLVGFSAVTSLDKLEAFGTSAANHLAAKLFVPHIAADTNTWFTKANVVNGSDKTVAGELVSGTQTRTLDNSSGYSKDSFDFLDKFDGQLPEGSPWGYFQEGESQASLVGNEIFGRADGKRQLVGLGLAEAPADNPSFSSSTNTIYFTHIARDINNFWTGLALVNIEPFEQSAIVRGYGANGVVINDKIIQVPAQGKVVQLADDFLDGIGSPADIDWVEVQADGGIVGYELFGTWNTKTLTGIEAIYDVRTQITFPFIDATGESWHGFSVVNVSNEEAEVSFSLMNGAGEAIGSPIVRTVKGKEKKIFLYEALFGTLDATAAWIKVTSTKELAGFQLFGTSETMSGIIAQ